MTRWWNHPHALVQFYYSTMFHPIHSAIWNYYFILLFSVLFKLKKCFIVSELSVLFNNMFFSCRFVCIKNTKTVGTKSLHINSTIAAPKGIDKVQLNFQSLNAFSSTFGQRYFQNFHIFYIWPCHDILYHIITIVAFIILVLILVFFFIFRWTWNSPRSH
jgi:hypothetical protein